jgi:serine/threonine-protein kinase SRPK3
MIHSWGKDEAGYVALKMLTAGEPFAEGSEEDRSLKLRLVSKLNLAIHHGTAPVGNDYCVQTFESFVAGSKHGDHLCLVTPPYGSSIDEFVRAGDRRILPFSPDTTKNLGRQTLLALNCIHSLGFVHTSCPFPASSYPKCLTPV